VSWGDTLRNGLRNASKAASDAAAKVLTGSDELAKKLVEKANASIDDAAKKLTEKAGAKYDALAEKLNSKVHQAAEKAGYLGHRLAKEVGGAAKDAAKEIKEQTKAGFNRVATEVKAQAAELAEQAKPYLQQAENAAREAAGEVLAAAVRNPMLAGAVGVAGAGVGLAVAPETTAKALYSLGKKGVQGYFRYIRGDRYSPEKSYDEIEAEELAKVPCVKNKAELKALRRRARTELIQEAEARAQSLPLEQRSPIEQAAKDLRRDMDAVERARLSKHVYADAGTPPPTGFSEVGEDELRKLGLSSAMLSPPNSTFKAALYKTQPDVYGVSKYVLTFRGTTSRADWEQNIRQGVGAKSEYYQRAMKIAKKLGKSGKDFEVTGHSLGGGMASAAALAAGVSATTFDAAGLHPNTVSASLKSVGQSWTPEAMSQVAAYRVKGEMLTDVQENLDLISDLAPDAIGIKHEFDPPAQGISGLNLHHIDVMIDGIEKKKQSDEAILAKAL
jgi:hypothetical protein